MRFSDKWVGWQLFQGALSRLAAFEKERRHRRAYEAQPVHEGEFGDWESEQVWPD